MMWFIPQNKKAIFPLLTSLCLLPCFMVGCKEAAPPAKPAVVSKRIVQAPEIINPVKKTAPSVKETRPVPEPISIPDTKDAPQAEAVKTDTAETIETATGKTASRPEQTIGEQLSLKSSLPDTSPLYSPAGKIDPFAPLFSEDSGSADSKETAPKRPRTPLEQIDLSQLQLVAILQTQNGNKAMVEDSTGKGYVLTPGTFIGINSGKVTKILRDSIIVEEETKDFLGRVNTNAKEIKLQKPFGEE